MSDSSITVPLPSDTVPVSHRPFDAYLKERLAELEITPELNIWLRTEKSDEFIKEWRYPFFEAEPETGNILIHYIGLDGRPCYWKSENNKYPKDYIRTRLRCPTKNQKYTQEKGSPQFPFFSPSILRKYSEKAKIESLIIIEGEFKAFKGAMHGFDAVGIASIHGFYNGDVRGKLHEDIQELIIACQVKNIVFLTDADTLSVNWEEGKDLAKRPQNFVAAVKYFRESLQQLLDDKRNNLSNVYYLHLLPKFISEAKGLDDLLVMYSSVHDDIRSDLLQFQFSRKYFTGFMLNDYNSSISKLNKHFGLIDQREFYQVYRSFIGDREFNFNRKRYHWDSELNEVTFVKHEDAVKFMRIGSDYLKIIKVNNKYGEPEEDMIPFRKSEIVQDYGKDFIDEISKYDSFAVDPSFNGEYKRVINNCYNLMTPLSHDPKEGVLNYTNRFLKHLFQGNGTMEQDVENDPFTVAIDYFTIQYRYPKQMLPVPILVSPENDTGKSTLLKWTQAVYGSNMVILNNEQFKSKFNVHYASKFIIGIDEGFLDVDKKSEKERLKQLVTADQIYIEMKGVNLKKILYYGKVMICSNDADRIMKIDEGETRWFVVRVPKVKERDPDMETKLKLEIPAWLHFLRTREIFHKRQTRLWFTPENIVTEQFNIIVKNTKNRLDRVFEDWIQEQFLTFQQPVLRYHLSYLTKVFSDPGNSKYRIDAIELRAYLRERLGMEPDKLTRFDIPVGHSESGEINWMKVNQRPYVFRAERWLNEEELTSWGKSSGQEHKSISAHDGQTEKCFDPKSKDEAPF